MEVVEINVVALEALDGRPCGRLEFRGAAADQTVLDLTDSQLIVRGSGVGLVISDLTTSNGRVWVYGGAALSLSNCELDGTALQVIP